MKITVSEFSKESRLRDLLDTVCRDSIVSFLDKIAEKIPNKEWVNLAISEMTPANSSFARQGGDNKFSDLDIRQLCNVLSRQARLISKHVSIPANLESKASCVWGIAKSLFHGSRAYDIASYNEDVSDVICLMRKVDCEDSVIEELSALIHNGSGQKHVFHEPNIPAVMHEREVTLSSFRNYHIGIYNESWKNLDDAGTIEEKINSFVKGDSTRLCLLMNNLADIIQCPHELYVIIDKQVSASGQRITANEISNPGLSHFWLDIIRSLWNRVEEIPKWTYTDIALSQAYGLLLDDGTEVSISTIRVMLERDGRWISWFGKYGDDGSHNAEDEDFEKWKNGTSDGQKFFSPIAFYAELDKLQDDLVSEGKVSPFNPSAVVGNSSDTK